MKTLERYGTVLRVYDNGGKTFDRYTVLPPRWASEEKESNWWNAIGSSEHPYHPGGFGQNCQASAGPHLGKRIHWEDLPKDVRTFASQMFPRYAPKELPQGAVHE